MPNKASFLFSFLISIFLLFACDPNPYREGERLYKKNCANCHMDNGEGLSALIPPLAGADFLQKNREKLPCIVKYGMKDSIFVNGKMYSEQMAGVETLSDIHITNVLNYINNSWGNRHEPYRLDEVRKFLERCTLNEK
jgi:mono/diheme cytochrome c family protein